MAVVNVVYVLYEDEVKNEKGLRLDEWQGANGWGFGEEGSLAVTSEGGTLAVYRAEKWVRVSVAQPSSTH